MRTIISFTALLVSVGLMQLANGALGPLDALSGIYFSFSSFQIGMLGSSHYLGFIFGHLGCFGVLWGSLGIILGPLGRLRGHLEVMLGSSGCHLG